MKKDKKEEALFKAIEEVMGALSPEMKEKFEEKGKYGGGDYEGNWPLVKNPNYLGRDNEDEEPLYIRQKQHSK